MTSLSSFIAETHTRLDNLKTEAISLAQPQPVGYSLTAYVVQIGGAGCYLGMKTTGLGGVFGIESAERFDHRSALHATQNLRNADNTKSNSGSVVAYSVALVQEIEQISSLIATLQAHLAKKGDNPDFL